MKHDSDITPEEKTPRYWYNKKISDLAYAFSRFIMCTTRKYNDTGEIIYDKKKYEYMVKLINELLDKDAEYDFEHYGNNFKLYELQARRNFKKNLKTCKRVSERLESIPWENI